MCPDSVRVACCVYVRVRANMPTRRAHCALRWRVHALVTLRKVLRVIAERPRDPAGVAAFMSTHSKIPCVTRSMGFSSGKGVVRGRGVQQLTFTLVGDPLPVHTPLQGISSAWRSTGSHSARPAAACSHPSRCGAGLPLPSPCDTRPTCSCLSAFFLLATCMCSARRPELVWSSCVGARQRAMAVASHHPGWPRPAWPLGRAGCFVDTSAPGA